MNWRGGERIVLLILYDAHYNAAFLNKLSSNAYEFDERLSLKEKSCYLHKKNINWLTEHSSHKNFGSASKRSFQELKRNSIIGKLVFKGEINSG